MSGSEYYRVLWHRLCGIGSWGGLWHRLLGWPASESGRLCRGDRGHGRGDRRPAGVDVGYPPRLCGIVFIVRVVADCAQPRRNRDNSESQCARRVISSDRSRRCSIGATIANDRLPTEAVSALITSR